MSRTKDQLQIDLDRHQREIDRQFSEQDRINDIAIVEEEKYIIRIYRTKGTNMWTADVGCEGETWRVGSDFTSSGQAFYYANKSLDRAVMQEAERIYKDEIDAEH